MEYAAAVYNKLTGAAIHVHSVQSVQEAQFVPGTIDVLTLGVVKAEDIPCTAEAPKPFGLGATALGGEAAFRYVKRVIELALAGEVDATVTNALSKEAINMAGHHFSGHTEIYAHYTNTDKYTMMLAHEDLRVVHVSTHVSLREACDRVKKPRVLEVIRIADAGCRALGIEKPRVAVAGLNPHCGENGLFGTEEIEEIQPAIDEAMAEGICIPDKSPRRRTRCSPRPSAAGTTSWCVCTTTRAHPPEGQGLCVQPRGKALGRGGGRERDARTADHPRERGPRHGLRPRRKRPCQRPQPRERNGLRHPYGECQNH